MIKAVIFDVGGVLHTNESESVRQDIIDTLGVTQEKYDEAIETLIPKFGTGKMSEKEFWIEFIKLTGSTRPFPKESLWEREYRRKYKVMKEVIEIVKALKDKGLKLAILSNTIDPHARVNKKRGIFKLFDEVILSHKVGLRKPDPKIFHLTLTRLIIRPYEAIFIDDSPENVQAAINLGMKGIVFIDARGLIKDLRYAGLFV